jgi:hypothetical protein
MNELSQEQVDRFEFAHAIFDQGHGAAKSRLLAALAEEVPSSKPLTWKNRGVDLMRSHRVRLTAAAVILISIIVGLQFVTSKSLLAQTVKAMTSAQGYRCVVKEINAPTTLQFADKTEFEQIGILRWSAAHGDRFEASAAIGTESIQIRSPKSGFLEILNKTKEYRIQSPQNRPATMGIFVHLNEHRGKSVANLESQVIHGIKAEGFVVPWSVVVDDDGSPDRRANIWVDPRTRLPLRVELLGMNAQHPTMLMRFDDFVWGPQDPALFAMTPPAGYKKIENPTPTVEQLTEWIRFGLSTFAKYNDGRYPAVKSIYGDEQGEALRKLMNMPRSAQLCVQPTEGVKWNATKEAELTHGSFGISRIYQLQTYRPECVYNGRTVTSRDANKVLLRWKVDDNQFRLIYGDLRAETVSKQRLQEIESK